METSDKRDNDAPAGDEPRSADEVPQEDAVPDQSQKVESKPNGDDDKDNA